MSAHCAVEQLPFLDNSKDVILNRSVMWTLLQPDVALKEWLRVLKQGGVLLCFCSIGEGTVGNNHYSQEIEDMLPLKGGTKYPRAMLATMNENLVY
ncbi:methyltransferase domain-containing protein [Desulfosporosinus burensis]